MAADGAAAREAAPDPGREVAQEPGATAAEVAAASGGSARRRGEEADAASTRRAVALAGMLLPVMLLGHVRSVEGVQPAAVSPVPVAGIAASAGSDASMAPVLPSAATSAPSPAGVHVEASARPVTTASRPVTTIVTGGANTAAGRSRAPISTTARPALTRPAPKKEAAADVLSEARLEAARAHLVSVHRALHVQGDRAEAKGMLQLYELTFPEDPFPSKRAELSEALNAP